MTFNRRPKFFFCTTLATCVLCILQYSDILAQDENNLRVPYFNIDVTLDGTLDEEVWSDLQPITQFHNHFPNDAGLAKNQTAVKIFHNSRHLIISAIYYDDTNRHNVNSLKRDAYEDGFVLSDCFGIAIDPFNSADNGYLFAVNAQAVQFDGLIGNVNELSGNWNAIWQAKTSKSGNRKIYEIAIPLDAINFNPNESTWGIQFFINDSKTVQWSTWVHSPRNFTQYDLRYTQKMTIENLPDRVSNKYSVTPSIAGNYLKDASYNTDTKKIIPSIDGQFNITSSLRLDVTLNPDFSQVEVDRQVTNLTRFAINFPEQRKFFLENSDLFVNLGTFWSNPFYSRRIGSQSDILYGAKLSGNLGNKTRIGILNAQTKNSGNIDGKNYTVAVGRYNLSKSVAATVFIVNTQDKVTFNRTIGSNVNYRSPNNKWRSDFQFANAFSKINDQDGNRLKTDDQNRFINGQVAYETRELEWSLGYQNVGKNYIAESGFIPLQSIYDADADATVREGFTMVTAEFQLKHYPKKSKSIDWMRRFWIIAQTVFNDDQSLRYNNIFFSPFAIRFKNRSYTYVSFNVRRDRLRYSFDFLQNGQSIQPGIYTNTFGRIGYWSPINDKFYYALRFEYGQFYGGSRLNPAITFSYRMMPRAVISAGYEINEVNLNELGQRSFHLARLSSEIYINNQLNWTTYLQYNTQANNFNINSRVQWEYNPLSYIYLVFTNNYNNEFVGKNWGISFKINRRFDF